MIRVLIVDDSAFMRRVLQQVFGECADIQVVGTGRNGREAVELNERFKPDLITLDIEMPELNGLEALHEIMKRRPTSVIMVSSLTTEGSAETLKALQLGAADFFAKNHSTVATNVAESGDELVEKVRAIAGHAAKTRRHTKPTASPASPTKASTPTRATTRKPPSLAININELDCVCIGSSTGGPPVLETILTRVPAGFPLPIVVAQHMPPVFTQTMARRLNDLGQVRVVHGEDGLPVKPGTIYIAPGGKHLHLVKHGLTRVELRTSEEPAAKLYRPSVDVLLSTATQCFGRRCLGVVLTGIGDDGKEGAADLKRAGGRVVSQSAASCVVYGMPRSVETAGLSDAVLDPDGVADLLVSLYPGQSRAA